MNNETTGLGIQHLLAQIKGRKVHFQLVGRHGLRNDRLEVFPFEGQYIKTGQQCRVIAGPLLGLQGVVATTRGAARLVLQVDMLGQAASVEIDIDMIETVD